MINLFDLDGVSLVDRGVTILDTVDLSLSAGGITCLVGPSGSGKTSLLRLLNRLDVPTAGTVSFRGEPLDQLDPLKLRRTVAMVFQRPSLFPGSVSENLRVAAPEVDDQTLNEILARVHLDVALGRNVDYLSGGEAQRLCLARALLTGPEVVLADEPTSSLDQTATNNVEDLFLELAGDGISIILVSHDVAQMLRIADRVAMIDQGRVIAHDEREAVVASRDPSVRRVMEQWGQ